MMIPTKRKVARAQHHVPHRFVQPLGNRFISPDGDRLHDECRRGLGEFRVLEDEMILEVLRSLESDDLGRMARVSKAFYVFGREEELWRSAVVRDFGGSFRFQGTWFSTFVYERTGVERERQAVCERLDVRGFYSDALMQSWRCGHAELQSFARVDNIERRSGLTLQEFIEQYERPSKPVILTDVVPRWPAFKTWNKETLLERYGDVVFKVGCVDMRLRDYWQYCDQACEETPLYLFDNDFTVKAPEMLHEYQVPEYFAHDYFAFLDGDGAGGDGCGEAGDDDSRPSYRWILIGPPRSGSTFHKDPNYTSAWNGLISGCKKWMLFPPHVTPPGVFPSADEVDVTTPLSVSEWFLNYYHESRDLRPVECNQQPGEMIFIPSQWWHTALNLEPSIAVTQNYVSQRNLYDVLEFLQRNDKIVLKNTLEYRIRQREPHVMQDIDQRRRKLLEPKKPSFWQGLTGHTHTINHNHHDPNANQPSNGTSPSSPLSSSSNHHVTTSFSFSFM